MMTGSSFDKFALDNFAGKVRLFPLPTPVLFPHVVQPLHIFEPRYQALLSQAMEGDQLVTMAVLRPGWEDAEEPRGLERQVCVGRVMSHTPLPDGRSNILLLGVQRAVIRRELPQRELFREAEVELLEDIYPQEGAGRRAIAQDQLLEAVRSLLPQANAPLQQQMAKLLAAHATLGMLTDVVASIAELSAELKLRLLGEPDVDLRASLLLQSLRAPRPPYPPEFSDN